MLPSNLLSTYIILNFICWRYFEYSILSIVDSFMNFERECCDLVQNSTYQSSPYVDFVPDHSIYSHNLTIGIKLWNTMHRWYAATANTSTVCHISWSREEHYLIVEKCYFLILGYSLVDERTGCFYSYYCLTQCSDWYRK